MIDDQSKGDIIMLGRKSTIVLHSDCTQHTTPFLICIYIRSYTHITNIKVFVVAQSYLTRKVLQLYGILH